MRGIVGTRVNSCIGAILIAAIIASWPLAVERTAAGEEKRETGEDEADARRESVSASYLQTPCFSTSTHRPSQPARGTYQTSDGSQVPAGARSDARGSTKNSDGEDSDSSTLTGPPVKLFIRPPTAVVRADGTYKFGARAMDASGTMFPVDADWSSENGTVDGSGLFNPWSVGAWSVHAWYAGIGASALAEVVPGVVKKLEIMPAEVEIPKGGAATVGLNATDSRGNAVTAFSAVWEESDGLLIEKATASGSELRLQGIKSGRWSLEVFVGDGNRTVKTNAIVSVKSDDYWALLAGIVAIAAVAVLLHLRISARKQEHESPDHAVRARHRPRGATGPLPPPRPSFGR